MEALFSPRVYFTHTNLLIRFSLTKPISPFNPSLHQSILSLSRIILFSLSASLLGLLPSLLSRSSPPPLSTSCQSLPPLTSVLSTSISSSSLPLIFLLPSLLSLSLFSLLPSLLSPFLSHFLLISLLFPLHLFFLIPCHLFPLIPKILLYILSHS